MNLVGQQAALAGTAKVFDTLQNQTLNKQARGVNKHLSIRFPKFSLQNYSALLRPPRNRHLRRFPRVGRKQRLNEVQEIYGVKWLDIHSQINVIVPILI